MDTVTFTSVTPNLLVADMTRAVAFYRDVLGLRLEKTVPDAAPFVFAWMQRDTVSVFLNDAAAAIKDAPWMADRRPGGGNTLFLVVNGLDALLAHVASQTPLLMPLTTQFYGMREFAIADPDGYIIIVAEPVAGRP